MQSPFFRTGDRADSLDFSWDQWLPSFAPYGSWNKCPKRTFWLHEHHIMFMLHYQRGCLLWHSLAEWTNRKFCSQNLDLKFTTLLVPWVNCHLNISNSCVEHCILLPDDKVASSFVLWRSTCPISEISGPNKRRGREKEWELRQKKREKGKKV